MHADDDRHRAGLAALVVLAHDDAAVLAGRHHDGGDIRPLGLDAIAAAVDPAGIRILHDHHAGGPDEVSAVVLVPDRRRDLGEVDGGAFEHILEQRTAVDLSGLEARRLFHVVAPPVHELHLGSLRRQAQGDVDARHRGQDIGEDARSLGKSGNLVEHDGRIAHPPLVDVDDAADFLLRLGTADGRELPGCCNRIDPIPQILVGHRYFPLSVSARINPPA